MRNIRIKHVLEVKSYMDISPKDSTKISRKRRILTLDGGGILGTFPAAFLAGIEHQLGHPISNYFDLICGTSTGGIIAIGLGLGLSASDILTIYQDGAAIFGQNYHPAKNFVLNRLRGVKWLVRRKYSSDVLRDKLVEALGDRKLGEAARRLVIPAWSPVAQRVYIYKTAHHPRFTTDYNSLAVDAALATSAAPTFFQQHITSDDVGLIDGGIWANNPIAVAVTEAIGVLQWPADSLHVLSLGCLNEAYNLPKGAGIGLLAQKLVKLFMDGQSHGAMGIAKLLTGHEHERKAIYRIDHTVPANRYTLDGVEAIQDLKGLGFTLAREQLPILKPIFFSELADPFVPYYTPNK